MTAVVVQVWFDSTVNFLTWENASLILLDPAAAASASLQSCPTLCNPRDGSPPGSSVPGILQARTLECIAISFSNAWKWRVKMKSLSRVWLFTIPWTAAYHGVFQARGLEWGAIAFSDRIFRNTYTPDISSLSNIWNQNIISHCLPFNSLTVSLMNTIS